MRGEPFAESRATLRREGLLTYASCSAYWLPFTTAKVPPLVAYLSPPWQCPSSPPCAFSARAWRLWGSSALPRRGPAYGRPATASGARASRLPSR